MAIDIERIECPGHEEVLRVSDPLLRLLGFIAIHSTARGPAAGGLRMRDYGSEAEALEDVLRLSEGMSFKTAAADLPLGGGKAVILGDPASGKPPELLRAFGQAIQSLEGRYWTAEDMGMTPADMAVLAESTDFVAGLPTGPYASGDPSPYTARGILRAMETTLRHATGTGTLAGRRVAVQGLGNVGRNLAALLHEAGAALVVADPVAERVEGARESFAAEAVPTGRIHAVPADVFAPCAVGGILTRGVIPELDVTAVVGGANNQLPGDAEGDLLHGRGILYAPDYVANAGGIINVAAEILRIDDRDAWVADRIDAIGETLERILDVAAERDVSPNRVSAEALRPLIGD